MERRQREKLSKTQAKVPAVTPPKSPPISSLQPEVTAPYEPIPFSKTSKTIPDPFSNKPGEQKHNGNGHSVESVSVASQGVIAPVATEIFVAPVVQTQGVEPEKRGEPLPPTNSPLKTADRPPNGSPAQDPEKVKKRQNALTRILWTFIMIGGFIGKPHLSSLGVSRPDITLSLAPSGTCLYDPPCHAMPNSGVPRSHCFIFLESCVTRVE